MIYERISEGIFQKRPNRFIADVEIGGHIETVHVKNTGRCKELLIPGAKVYLDRPDNKAHPNRATKYDLIAAQKGGRLINMDSQAPNKAFLEYLRTNRHIEGITFIKPEAKYGDNSRFDFYVEAGKTEAGEAETGKRKIFIEVKGVTLEENGTALFPDAPTERGVKHLNELVRCVGDGYEAQVVFVIQMKNIRYFTPNNAMHPEFGAALAKAEKAGVKVMALDCEVTPDSMVIGDPVPVRL